MDAAAGSSEALTSFSAEEQRLLEELRSKYTRGPPAPPPPPVPATVQTQPPHAAAAQPAGCRLCAECQGTGTVVEAYNHRTMQRCCTRCCGQGTVRTDGESGGSSTHGGSSTYSSNSPHSGASSSTYGSTHIGSGAGAKSAHERLAGWDAELAALKQSLAGVTDSQELQLKSALMLELERAAASLRTRLKQEDQLPLTQELADMLLASSTAEEEHERSGSEDTRSPEDADEAEHHAAVEAAGKDPIQAAAAAAAAALREHPAMQAGDFDLPGL